ncbi:adenosylcobinamide-phosphate synthase [Vibrio aerogenes CECT 7868]|uniref:Adenosylcobinamide-phosphate synthase n=1 Tax=Vibrio aerogenes CECT 7868 TaxID=1216006 RepID=A0A1M5WQF3_9VIBR|nr:cobalamin biosynthesis family protein [Vibrio aerogenes]SHH89721.1 adenosylcobinamide-phosphate synthase [Vibrio aerogenes CECT 7868]
MNPVIEIIQANSALLILWGALLIHFILPIPRHAHPVTLWHKFAEILAEKVNGPNSFTQKGISGAMAWALMVIPALILLIAFRPLVWQPEFYDLALLLLALNWREQTQLASGLIKALSTEDKQTARQLLSETNNRQTAALSIVGLGKAGAETLIVGQARQVVAVMFWYGIAGGCGAFIFRLITELSRAWSPSQPACYPFGVTSARLLALLEAIPSILFTGLLLPGKSLPWRQIRTQAAIWPSFAPGWLLATVGNKLNLSLGGPAIYDGKKSVRTKIGGRIVPSALHLSQTQRMLNQRTFIWILAQSLITFMIMQVI